jgi:hypothetical protein
MPINNPQEPFTEPLGQTATSTENLPTTVTHQCEQLKKAIESGNLAALTQLLKQPSDGRVLIDGKNLLRFAAEQAKASPSVDRIKILTYLAKTVYNYSEYAILYLTDICCFLAASTRHNHLLPNLMNEMDASTLTSVMSKILANNTDWFPASVTVALDEYVTIILKQNDLQSLRQLNKLHPLQRWIFHSPLSLIGSGRLIGCTYDEHYAHLYFNLFKHKLVTSVARNGLPMLVEAVKYEATHPFSDKYGLALVKAFCEADLPFAQYKQLTYYGNKEQALRIALTQAAKGNEICQEIAYLLLHKLHQSYLKPSHSIFNLRNERTLLLTIFIQTAVVKKDKTLHMESANWLQDLLSKAILEGTILDSKKRKELQNAIETWPKSAKRTEVLRVLSPSPFDKAVQLACLLEGGNPATQREEEINSLPELDDEYKKQPVRVAKPEVNIDNISPDDDPEPTYWMEWEKYDKSAKSNQFTPSTKSNSLPMYTKAKATTCKAASTTIVLKMLFGRKESAPARERELKMR